jgi:hypothetical protein
MLCSGYQSGHPEHGGRGTGAPMAVNGAGNRQGQPVSRPPANGPAITAAVQKVLPGGQNETQIVGRIGRGDAERRYLVWRMQGGELYLHVEWPQPAEDVLLRFFKRPGEEWSSTKYAWRADRQGWRPVSKHEQETILAELPKIAWTDRGDIPVTKDPKDPDLWVCEYGDIIREVTTGEFRAAQVRLLAEGTIDESQVARDGFSWAFVPSAVYQQQGLVGFEADPTLEAVVNDMRTNVFMGPNFDSNPVLTRFRPPNAITFPPTMEYALDLG